MDEVIHDNVRVKTRQNIKDVVTVTAYNYQLRVYTHGLKPCLSRRDMCEKFGVPANNFGRTYRQWVNWAGGVCNELDRKAQVAVALC